MDSRKIYIGWAQAFVAILVFLGINQVTGRFAAVVLDANPVIYSCTAFASCALVLLLRAGPGPLGKETMRSVDTWVYGAILMMSYIIGMLLFALVTSTEGTMLQKVSVLLGILGSWFFLGRQPDIYQMIGTAVITAAVVMVAYGLQGDSVGAVYLLAFLYGALQVGRIFAAELHRPHSKAASKNDPKSKARVIGFVMFIISVIFLLATFLVALAQEAQTGDVIRGLPVLADFLHAPTIIAGMIAGVVIVAPSRVLEFSSSYVIKAENFTTVTALSFVSTLFWEWASSPLTGLSIKSISQMDIVAGGMITAGGLFIALTRRVANKKKNALKGVLTQSVQDLDAIDDSREILATALEHFGGDTKAVAEALEVGVVAVEALLNDKERVLAFTPDMLKRVTRRYRKNVALRDALTGLANRAGFMTALKGASYEAEVFSVLYIDLDKFKPVNDTYGHKAGDMVLKGVGQRLAQMYSRHALATRLGGDEFAVLLLDADKAKAQGEIARVRAAVAEPFTFEGHEIVVGASVGVATYPDDGDDPEALLKHADSTMYGEKKR